MKEYKIKSFEFANGLIIQLITISSIIITVSATFIDKFISAPNINLLKWGWSFLFISILLGIFALMILTGLLNRLAQNEESRESIGNKSLKRLSALQIFTFLLGMFFFLVFSYRLLQSNSKEFMQVEEVSVVKETKYKLVEPIRIDTIYNKKDTLKLSTFLYSFNFN